jgi:hypothetical protein
MTIETTGGAPGLAAVSAGDQVQIRRTGAAATAPDRPSNPSPSRRLLGVWLLASTGTVIVLRARRTRAQGALP